MQPIKNTVQTDFALGGIPGAISDAQTLARGIRDALKGATGSRPLDGVTKGLADAQNQAEKFRRTTAGAGGAANVNIGVTGAAAATAAIKSVGKTLRDAFDDAKPGKGVDFDEVRNRILESGKAAARAAQETTVANDNAARSTRSLRDVWTTLRDRLTGSKTAADDVGAALEKAGKKGKDGADKTAKSSKDSADRLKNVIDRGVKLSDVLNGLGLKAASAGKALTLGFGDSALSGLRKAGELAGKAAAIGTIVAGLSGLSAGGIFGAVTEGSADYTRQIEKLANVSGIQVTAFSRLASYAKQFDVDLDDLRGSMVQFLGQASSAARGEDVQKYFQELGVDVLDAKGKIKETLPLLFEVARAQKGLTGSQRAGILNQLFGEDDSAKMVTFLDALGGTAKDLKTAVDGVDASGDIVTPEDVKQANDYKNALGVITASIRGLGRTIAREVLPDVTEFAKSIKEIVDSSREGIAKTASKAWSLLADGIRDVLKYFTSRKDYIKNTWITGLLDTVGSVAQGLGAAGRAVLEFSEVLRGRTLRDKDFEFPWLFDLKERFDRAFGGAGRVMTAFGRLMGGVRVDVKGNANVLSDSIDEVAKQGENALLVLAKEAPPTTWLGKKAKEAQDTADWFVKLKNAVLAVAAGDEVAPEFKWVKTLSDGATSTASSITKMATEITRALDDLRSFGAQMGITGDGILNFGVNFAGLAVQIAAVLLPLKLLAGGLGLVGLAGAAPLVLLVGMATALGLVIKRIIDNNRELAKLEEERKTAQENADALIYKYGLPGGEPARLRFNELQAKRRAMGLDAQDLQPGPYEPRPASLPARQAPVAANDDADKTLRDLVGSVKDLAAANGPALKDAIAAAANARGQAIVAAATPTAPGIVDRAAPTGSRPAAADQARQPIVIQLVAEDGSQENFEFDADTDVGVAFAEAVERQRRRSATQRPPKFAFGGGR